MARPEFCGTLWQELPRYLLQNLPRVAEEKTRHASVHHVRNGGVELSHSLQRVWVPQREREALAETPKKPFS